MTYQEMLDHERRMLVRYQAKQELARELNNNCALRIFESLEANAWKAIGDLGLLVRLKEQRLSRVRSDRT